MFEFLSATVFEIVGGNLWVVLASITGWQLHLLRTTKMAVAYDEGPIQRIQYLVGVPTLANLVLFMFDPDLLGFALIPFPTWVQVVGLTLFNLSAGLIFWSHLSLGDFWSVDL